MIEAVERFLSTRGPEFLIQLAAAVLLYIVGRWAIWGVRALVRRGFEHRKLDPTLSRYIDESLGVTLTILLVFAALGLLGVPTNSLAGLLAAAGVAVGVASSGLLSNVAAGLFMVAQRPFKTSDTVRIGGVLGTVEELGLFATTLLAADGTRVIVANAKAFTDNIQNLSAVPHRRVEARAQLPWGCDTAPLYDALRARLIKEPKVLESPAPVVDTLEHNAIGPVATIRPYCAPADYLEVLFLTQRILGEELRKAEIPAPNRLAGALIE
jgi:small conductance mechanosensitive channel